MVCYSLSEIKVDTRQLCFVVAEVLKPLEHFMFDTSVSMVITQAADHGSAIPGIWALSVSKQIKLQWSILYCYCISKWYVFHFS